MKIQCSKHSGNCKKELLSQLWYEVNTHCIPNNNIGKNTSNIRGNNNQYCTKTYKYIYKEKKNNTSNTLYNNNYNCTKTYKYIYK